jgi:tRNA G18 (ribose-2'-O)-methylase SpoU
MGGVFHLPLHIHPDFDHLFKILEGQGYDLIGTSPHSKKNLNSHTFQPKTALLLGNEAHGSSYQRRIQKWLSIPTPGIESLNVAQAGSIFLYQWANPPLAQPH